MAECRIPVDVRNPGQVFACLGLMELAQILCGPALGGFEAEAPYFTLTTAGDENPVAAAVEFLAGATAAETPSALEDEPLARPIALTYGEHSVPVGHWADVSSRGTFKLYAGTRSAAKIAGDMLRLIQGLERSHLIDDPWNTLCPMGGSFNFDPRGGWTAMNTGFSPNKHASASGNVMASPAVELAAAIGLQHARPAESRTVRRQVGYSAWNLPLPLALARAALGGGMRFVPQSRFRFQLLMSGKNKVVTFAQQEDEND